MGFGGSPKAAVVSRRRFLALGAPAIVAASSLSGIAKAAVAPDRKVKLYNIHTSEKLATTYFAEGEYQQAALAEIDHILRDWRTDEVEAMDQGLIDLLHDLHRRVESSEPFHIISGYRSPKTNAKLAANSGGVAKKSLHMQGKAADVALPGRDLAELRQTALDMKRGGVGFYPKSGFIHVDTGRVRFW